MIVLTKVFYFALLYNLKRLDHLNKSILHEFSSLKGGVPGGLIVHPDQQHLVYSVGNTIVVENIVSKKQRFLVGHTDNISCVTLSKSGQFIASGQVTHMGFKADIIVWDYGKCAKYCLLTLHKVKVEALAFSPNDKYLVSLGGQDDNRCFVLNF